MIELQEFNKYLSIMGFKDVRIPSVDGLLNQIRKRIRDIPLQVFDANCIAGTRHLLFATLNALNSFEQNQNISESLEVEILLYASGQRQISKAIDTVGLKQDTSEVAVVFVTADREGVRGIEEGISQIVPGKRDDGVVDLREGKTGSLVEAFGITDAELAAVSELRENLWEALEAIIVERTALLVTRR